MTLVTTVPVLLLVWLSAGPGAVADRFHTRNVPLSTHCAEDRLALGVANESDPCLQCLDAIDPEDDENDLSLTLFARREPTFGAFRFAPGPLPSRERELATRRRFDLASERLNC